MITSNHIHLLIKDTGPNVIARSMQLIAEYNQRKTRQGAFWEDRYHATAIETDEHLHRCLVYIDLNMVRAGVVDHPVKWEHSGYHEIQQPPKRYAVIDLPGLVALCGFSKLADFQQAHCQWIEAALHGDLAVRDARWSEAVAVGSLSSRFKGRPILSSPSFSFLTPSMLPTLSFSAYTYATIDMRCENPVKLTAAISTSKTRI